LTDSVFAFTDLPIRLLVRTGALGTAAAAAFGLAVDCRQVLPARSPCRVMQ